MGRVFLPLLFDRFHRVFTHAIAPGDLANGVGRIWEVIDDASIGLRAAPA
jgi:hypothetical protein